MASPQSEHSRPLRDARARACAELMWRRRLLHQTSSSSALYTARIGKFQLSYTVRAAQLNTAKPTGPAQTPNRSFISPAGAVAALLVRYSRRSERTSARKCCRLGLGLQTPSPQPSRKCTWGPASCTNERLLPAPKPFVKIGERQGTFAGRGSPHCRHLFSAAACAGA